MEPPKRRRRRSGEGDDDKLKFLSLSPHSNAPSPRKDQHKNAGAVKIAERNTGELHSNRYKFAVCNVVEFTVTGINLLSVMQ